jgi:hypothetical protein
MRNVIVGPAIAVATAPALGAPGTSATEKSR